jgi:hypothetical protein
MLHEIESLRGYNPLDTLRYKEYLQLIRDEDGPLVPFGDPLAFPVISDFPIRNKRLLDLLGVRYLLQPSDRPLEQNANQTHLIVQTLGAQGIAPGSGLLGPFVQIVTAVKAEEFNPVPLGWQAVEYDAHPHGYDFAVGGVRTLPPYTVYENTQVMPRVFVVPHAKPLPERSKLLAALTETDFRDTVLLEKRGRGHFPAPEKKGTGTFSRSATIRSYQPNRVVIDVEDGPEGYLVLTDIWYPGWVCTVDGTPQTIDRANYLFRAVEVGPGSHTVEFTFAPGSYHRGMQIALATLALILCVNLLALGSRLTRHRSFAVR